MSKVILNVSFSNMLASYFSDIESGKTYTIPGNDQCDDIEVTLICGRPPAGSNVLGVSWMQGLSRDNKRIHIAIDDGAKSFSELCMERFASVYSIMNYPKEHQAFVINDWVTLTQEACAGTDTEAPIAIPTLLFNKTATVSPAILLDFFMHHNKLIIKPMTGANGDNQMIISPRASSALTKECIARDYEWMLMTQRTASCAAFIGTTMSSREASEVDDFWLHINDCYDVQWTGQNGNPNATPSAVSNLLNRSIVQENISDKVLVELRAFVLNGEVVEIMHRPFGKNKRLAKMPDYSILTGSYGDSDRKLYLTGFTDEITRRIENVYPSIARLIPRLCGDLQSVDIFVTATNWGVFEFGHGYSRSAAGHKFIQNLHHDFLLKCVKDYFVKI